MRRSPRRVPFSMITFQGHEMYTAQVNAFGNVIICKGSDVRNSYRIVYTGSYAECLEIKARGWE